MANTRNRLKSHLISIVDDEKAVRDALSNLLESAGFTVEGFSSAEELLRSGDLSEKTCLIVDVRLPGMSGLELQSRLAGEMKSIPIIFITAHADEKARQEALEAGALEFFYKPFSAEAMLDAIRLALKYVRH
jgi:FixJ family two-component response regulator